MLHSVIIYFVLFLWLGEGVLVYPPGSRKWDSKWLPGAHHMHYKWQYITLTPGLENLRSGEGKKNSHCPRWVER